MFRKTAIIKIRILWPTVTLAPLMTLLVRYLVTAGVEVAPAILWSMFLCPVGEEVALIVVLAESLAVRGAGDPLYLLQVTVITEVARGEIIITPTGPIVTLVKIRRVATRHTVAFRSRRTWSWFLALNKWVEEVLVRWLWWALMSSCVMALMVGGPPTVRVYQAVSPVFVSLLSVVGPEVALLVVLAYCLAVRRVGDMLDMFYQGLGIITDNSFTNITWGKCCFSHSSSCWHSGSCCWEPCS